MSGRESHNYTNFYEFLAEIPKNHDRKDMHIALTPLMNDLLKYKIKSPYEYVSNTNDHNFSVEDFKNVLMEIKVIWTINHDIIHLKPRIIDKTNDFEIRTIKTYFDFFYPNLMTLGQISLGSSIIMMNQQYSSPLQALPYMQNSSGSSNSMMLPQNSPGSSEIMMNQQYSSSLQALPYMQDSSGSSNSMMLPQNSLGPPDTMMNQQYSSPIQSLSDLQDSTMPQNSPGPPDTMMNQQYSSPIQSLSDLQDSSDFFDSTILPQNSPGSPDTIMNQQYSSPLQDLPDQQDSPDTQTSSSIITQNSIHHDPMSNSDDDDDIFNSFDQCDFLIE